MNMEEKSNIIRILKSGDTKNISVLHAASTENDIRFYVNETQYIYATKPKGKEPLIGLGKDSLGNTNKTKLSLKEKVKFILSLLPAIFLIIIAVSGIGILTLLLAQFIDNPFLYILLTNIIWLSINLITVIVIENKETPPTLKSKHSAEHMMVNFLEKHNRLPKNMSEIKKSSRFSTNCGSREKVKGFTEDFICKTLAGIITIIIANIFSFVIENIAIFVLILILVYTLTLILSTLLLKKSKKLQFIVKPFETLLTSITQCANTKRNVDEFDIVLAYVAAKEWVKLVYPEFYNEEEDNFLDDFLKELENQ